MLVFARAVETYRSESLFCAGTSKEANAQLSILFFRRRRRRMGQAWVRDGTRGRTGRGEWECTLRFLVVVGKRWRVRRVDTVAGKPHPSLAS